jgi:hypothetical protein
MAHRRRTLRGGCPRPWAWRSARRRCLSSLRRPRFRRREWRSRLRDHREDDGVVIAYKDRTVRTTHFRLGPEVHRMTDREILDRFNAGIRATEALAADYQHVAMEVPPGRPQIAYFSRDDQWTPRGDVLRCVIDEGPDRMPLIHVDDHELSWAQFGTLLLHLRRLGHAHCLRARRPARRGAGDQGAGAGRSGMIAGRPRASRRTLDPLMTGRFTLRTMPSRRALPR